MRFEPHAWAHDHEHAGLRDYLPRPDWSRPPRRTWPWVLALGFLLGLAAGVTLGAAEPPTVSLQVRPLVMISRGDIRAEVRVSRHADNRLLSIAWTSDGGSEGSTLRPLEGDGALVLQTLELRSQPAANYLFIATVFNHLGKPRGRAEARIHVPDDRGTPHERPRP